MVYFATNPKYTQYTFFGFSVDVPILIHGFGSMDNKQQSADTETKTPITICYGDGVGPEIMDAVLRILAAADAAIEPQEIQIGEKSIFCHHKDELVSV